MSDELAALTELMCGARGLAIKVYDAGWRPPVCALCAAPVDQPHAVCGPCQLTAYTIELFANEEAA